MIFESVLGLNTPINVFEIRNDANRRNHRSNEQGLSGKSYIFINGPDQTCLGS